MFAVNVTIKRLGCCLLSLAFLAGFLAVPVSSAAIAEKNGLPAGNDISAPLNTLTSQAAPAAGDNENGNRNAEGFKGDVNVQVVAILTKNDEGEGFGVPTEIFCDKDTDETYVVTNAGGSRIVIYGDNYFPILSVGAGRGAEAPRAIDIDKNGIIYIVQSRREDQPPRVTLFNAAFFPEKQYNLADIDGVEMDFVPLNLSVGGNGNIYITGSRTRGVLVLREGGAFSHWLRPMDLIFDQDAIASQREEEEEAAAPEKEYAAPEKKDEIDLSGLPFDFLPGGPGSSYLSKEQEPGIGPVMVNNIKIDSNGNIYMLSPETGKVYVYNSQEEYLFSFGEKGGSTGKVSQPRGLVIDEKRNAIYIVDYMRHTILIYDRSGHFMFEFGGLGRGAGWFQYPSRACLNREGYLLVADLFNHRVQVLDVEFTYRFPLFQVPFVQEGIYKPQPMAQGDRFFSPGGFEPGQQASAELSPEKAIYKELDDNVL